MTCSTKARLDVVASFFCANLLGATDAPDSGAAIPETPQVMAAGLLNTGAVETPLTATLSDLKIAGRQRMRDLWRQKNLAVFAGKIETFVASHGVVFVRIFSDQD